MRAFWPTYATYDEIKCGPRFGVFGPPDDTTGRKGRFSGDNIGSSSEMSPSRGWVLVSVQYQT